MKKRILCVILLIIFVFGNDIHTFSSEISSTENDSITDETDYLAHAFGDKTYDGISVYASIDGFLPEKTEMNVSYELLDADKAIVMYYLNEQDKKIKNMTEVDISFLSNGEIIYLKDGSIVNFDILINVEESTGEHIVFRLINESNYEIISAKETIINDSLNELEEISQKKQFSFDITTTYDDSFKFLIIEIESIVEQNEGETIPEQEIVEPTPEENEVKTNSEQNETETNPDENETETNSEQSETETNPDENETETNSEKSEIETNSEQNETETNSEQNKAETKPEENDVKDNTSRSDKTEIGAENSSKNENSNHNNAEQRNETINIEGKIIWDDNNNQDGIRPNSVDVVARDDKGKTYPITIAEDEKYENEWKYLVKDLPKYRSGKEIKYSIIANKKVNGYRPEIDLYDVKYIHIPETVLIEGQIMWSDSINKDRIRPEEVIVKLYVEDDQKDDRIVSKETDWKYSFGEFPKYEEGNEIEYLIVEDSIEGYEPTYYGYNITNIHKAGTVSKAEEVSDETDKISEKKNIGWIIIPIIVFIAGMIIIIVKNDFLN